MSNRMLDASQLVSRRDRPPSSGIGAVKSGCNKLTGLKHYYIHPSGVHGEIPRGGRPICEARLVAEQVQAR